ncbi:MAG: hypothetical protein JWO81_2188 [Alphaproteobacteria bacterium]|nr:hypothetical protein [Alphaproteobacteria bacterium]
MTRLPLLAPLAFLALSPAAQAATPTVKRAMTCPIGGEAFDYQQPVSSAALGMRPDGKPYGTSAAPAPLPECPGNGLVLYKDYTADETKTLAPLVASDDYQALRRTDTQYYRAYWLMRQMGVGPEDYLWALLQAAWEAEGKPELRARYFGELAAASAKVPPNPADIDWIGMEGRSIDALRELGRFDEAAARLAKVPLARLDVAVPVGGGEKAVSEAKVKRGWLSFFAQLKVAIARRDASIEPFDMIPRSVALGYCIDRTASLADQDRTFCAKEQAGVEEVRTARAKAEDDIKALSRSREASGR